MVPIRARRAKDPTAPRFRLLGSEKEEQKSYQDVHRPLSQGVWGHPLGRPRLASPSPRPPVRQMLRAEPGDLRGEGTGKQLCSRPPGASEAHIPLGLREATCRARAERRPCSPSRVDLLVCT